MANRNWASAGKIYSMHVRPVLLDCNFTVDSLASDGTGISDLKGPCISAVYMNSTATPITTTSVFLIAVSSITVASATGLFVGMEVSDVTTGGNITAGTRITSISGTTITLSKPTAGASAAGPGDTLSFLPLAAGSPGNPDTGVIYVKFSDNYNRSYSVWNSIAQPLSGTPLTATVANTAYVITALGTATTAQWVAAGLPIGVTPALGVGFIASTTGTIGGSAAVQIGAAAGANITNIEVLGQPEVMLVNQQQPSYGGGYYILQCMKNGAIAAPATGSLISLSFYLSDSSVLIQGE